MGLLKAIDRDDTGMPVHYWHVSYRQDDYEKRRITVVLTGYADAAAYRAGKRPCGPALRYTLAAEDFGANADIHAVTTPMIYQAVRRKAALAANAPRDGNPDRLPEIGGIPTDPALAGATDA